MGLYNERILPYLIDLSMTGSTLERYRRDVLAEVSGEVLEIGFGTGLNLPYYPDRVRQIVTVDPSPGVHHLAQKRIKASPITVDHRMLSGEALPMADGTFDSVVSTFTLCSIPDIEQALAEIHRVLKPGGRFFFVEHGLSPEPGIQTWQNRLTPLQKRIAGGCHINRNMRQLIEQQFDQVELDAGYAEKIPKVAGYFYQGVATKCQPPGMTD
ncbi:class I SAM-dependent methyltransferase [Nodosilinea sp. LEGE 06152]|uniref:class I SAM-dependent methyltransferase n=1 Tax=Nodosilinea sp. LEGE 06152 TaxID=2777966 RepID=UPI00188233D1|nr:class I SAM-dependent methyltransferase [Nodosilinea sp. LEGE 06152]MBE9156057.1 class I SAM-dependent methyltransferase [Nodosilinea sp. LEGE 06152]